VRESSVPPLSEGQALVKFHYLGVNAALRLIVRDNDEFLFRVEPGDIVHGSTAELIIESRNNDLMKGDYVLVSGGVQNYLVSNGEGLEHIDINQALLNA